jgi:hypothetical protein
MPKAQIKNAHLNEANETSAKSLFVSGARGALKSVLAAIQIAVHTYQKWKTIKQAKQRIKKEDQELEQMEDDP